ncbi:MAG: hypothetical protein WKG07_29535 [Hymenobacter sp.]
MCLRWTITELIRRARRDGKSIREIARTFHHTRRKIRQVLTESEPRPYTWTNDRLAPVLGPFHAVVDRILIDDEAAPPKQRHTAAQVYRRLRDEHSYAGGYAQVQALPAAAPSPTSRNLHPSGTPPRSPPRGRFRSHPRRLPRRPTPRLLPRHHLGLLQHPFVMAAPFGRPGRDRVARSDHRATRTIPSATHDGARPAPLPGDARLQAGRAGPRAAVPRLELPACFAAFRATLEQEHGATAGGRRYARVLQLLVEHLLARVRDAIESCTQPDQISAESVARRCRCWPRSRHRPPSRRHLPARPIRPRFTSRSPT